MALTDAANVPPLEYRPLSVDPRGAFSCDVPEIDKWFHRCEMQHTKFRQRVTTVHFEGQAEIVAFYALSIKLEEERMLAPDDKQKWRSFNSSNRQFVCLNLDYLAVSKGRQKQGIGTVVLGRIIEEFAKIASMCGIELMTGSSLDQERFERFYGKLGFQTYGHAVNQPQLFLPALSAIAAVAQVTTEACP